MDDELLRALCALAAFCILLGIAAVVVRLQAARRMARARGRRQAMRDANLPPAEPSDARARGH